MWIKYLYMLYCYISGLQLFSYKFVSLILNNSFEIILVILVSACNCIHCMYMKTIKSNFWQTSSLIWGEWYCLKIVCLLILVELLICIIFLFITDYIWIIVKNAWQQFFNVFHQSTKSKSFNFSLFRFIMYKLQPFEEFLFLEMVVILDRQKYIQVEFKKESMNELQGFSRKRYFL